MKNIFTLLLLMLVTGVSAQIQVTSDISANMTWTAGNIYVLNGYIHVDSGAVLTIEPGTIIKGSVDTSLKSTLIIDRGAKLIAEGTANQPIVFTSGKNPGQRSYGDWGGVVLCGQAKINPPGGQAEVEGTPAGTTSYGGQNDDDSSGVLRYVRIEFCGIPLQPNKEINGLTLCGVGRKTVLDHIQVSFSGDDSYEFFGGTVQAKHLIAFRGVDDDFDTDFGWSGKVQWAVSLRDSNVADFAAGGASNGFESDNDANGSANTPETRGIFSNVTLVGPMMDLTTTPAAPFKRGYHIRRNSKLSVHNSIVMGWPVAFLLDGTACETNATNNDIQVRNNVFAGCVDSFKVATGSAFDLRAWYNTAVYSNEYYALNASAGLNDPFNYDAPDFRPGAGSSMLTGADFTNGNVSDPWFTSVSYRGAFGNTDWTTGWANWTPQSTVYEPTGIAKDMNAVTVSRVYPNPSAGEVTLELVLDHALRARLDVTDLSGKPVMNIADHTFGAGLNAITFSLDGLAQGMYFIHVQSESGNQMMRISKL